MHGGLAMAYFPNGTSGDIYLEKYCMLCLNWTDKQDGRGFGCPIWDAHQVANYKQCGDEVIKEILEILWPSDDKHYPAKCSMFSPNGECEGQLKLEYPQNTHTSP